MAPNSILFGNSLYQNLSQGEAFHFEGRTVTLLDQDPLGCTFSVNRTRIHLPVAQRALPTEVEGLRLFLADHRGVRQLTTDNSVHGLLNEDALICLSRADRPLLDSSRFSFPISRRDGFTWKMEEDSHMFAYLGLSDWIAPGHMRSHEGIDFDLHDTRGREVHPLIAAEAGRIVWVAGSAETGKADGCILLASESMHNVYYIYQHTLPASHQVESGQYVERGQILSYTLGDHRWGHLHFAVVVRNDTPSYSDRYTNVLNIFPQIYETWFGNLTLNPVVHTQGTFAFGQPYWTCHNALRLDAFDENVGYGWLLAGDFAAQKVERVADGTNGNARLRRILHTGTNAEWRNPDSFYTFEVAVPNGRYRVDATVGDLLQPTEQSVDFGNRSIVHLGLPAGVYKRTESHILDVINGRLSVKIFLGKEEEVAGLRELRFKRVN